MVGGKGTRLRPLTDNRPKPILPVLDKPCLSYLIRSLADGGIENVILACGYRSEAMAAAIGDGTAEGIKIEYSYEDVPMGTAGAIKLLEDKLDETFIAVNGDVFADIDLKGEIEDHKRTGASLTMSLLRMDNVNEFGVAVTDDTGRVTGFQEKPPKGTELSDLANTGIYVIEKEILKYVPKGVMYDFSKELTPDIMSKGYKVQGYITNGLWMDVGRPRDLIGANLAAAKRFGRTEYEGVTRTKADGTFYVGQGSTVTDSELLDSVISKGSVVTDSKISGSLIMASCTIDGAVISGSILGERCIIRKGASVIDSVLADGTVVGSGIIEGKKGGQ